MKKKFFIIIFLFPILAIAQHTIKGTFSPAEEYKWAILYRLEPTSPFYTADARLDEEGSFTINLDSSATKGMYRIMYNLPPEDNSFDIIYSGEENIEFTFSETVGIVFNTSNENQLLAAYEAEMYAIRSEIGEKYKNGYEEVRGLFLTLNELQERFETEAKGTLAYNFIVANSAYFPKKGEDLQTYISNTKSTYFDMVDFNNPILQASNFLIDYSFNYITGFVEKSENDSEGYNKNIDAVYRQLENCTIEYQKVLLHYLWQKLVDINEVSAANYIAEKYLIPVSTRAMDLTLVEYLVLYQSLSIGAKAPDFSWEENEKAKTTKGSLYKIDVAEKYVIVFWSSQCSHCLKEVPKLQELVKGFEPGKTKVIAVGLEDSPYDWENKVYDFPEFINVLGLGKWENKIGDDYNVNATPTYFVLDQYKKIVAKPEDFEALEKIIAPND